MAKFNVMGYKHSKGDFNGMPYDYVVVYTVAKLKRSDSQAGAAGIEFRAETSLLDKFKKMDFSMPVVCDVQFETVATGKGGFQELVVDVNPIVLPK